jgi:16S rRNA G966 N2-methylase RsmD
MKLRIIAGEFGGRIIEAPSGFTTHPMGERIRNALFNMLGDLSGKTVLDPYAGSGAIAIEAVSRGAASAVTIEKDRKAQEVIAANIANLHLENRVQLIRANCRAWSETTVMKASSEQSATGPVPKAPTSNNSSVDATGALPTQAMASPLSVPAEFARVDSDLSGIHSSDSALPLQSTALGLPPIRQTLQASSIPKPLPDWDGAQAASPEGLPQFDLIIADPPYNNLQLSTISLLTRHLKSTGSMILSHPGRESAPTVNGVVVVDNREYGDAALAIYRKEL